METLLLDKLADTAMLLRQTTQEHEKCRCGSEAKLCEMYFFGAGCKKDWAKAVYWSAHAYDNIFWRILCMTNEIVLPETVVDDTNILMMELGRGLYWHMYPGNATCDFYDELVEYYLTIMHIQQQSIFYFVLFWQRTTGVKDIGLVIAKLAWEGRYDLHMPIEFKRGKKRKG